MSVSALLLFVEKIYDGGGSVAESSQHKDSDLKAVLLKAGLTPMKASQTVGPDIMKGED